MSAIQPLVPRETGRRTFHEWLLMPKVQKRLVIFAFGAVPVALLVLFTYYPFIRMVEYSFYNMSYTKVRGFYGFKNYLDVFNKPELFATFRISLYYMAGAIVQITLALYFATVLSFRTKLTSIYKGAMFFPFLVNGIAIGFIFKFFYTRGYVLDTVLQA